MFTCTLLLWVGTFLFQLSLPKKRSFPLRISSVNVTKSLMENFIFLCSVCYFSVKGATKSYFTHYSCVVIILFNTGFRKSAFSTDFFGKLVFRVSSLSALYQIRCNLYKLYNICIVKVFMRCVARFGTICTI